MRSGNRSQRLPERIGQMHFLIRLMSAYLCPDGDVFNLVAIDLKRLATCASS